jgi:LPXTG-motif cell wall-anchored protein
MLSLHHWNAFLVIGVCLAASGAAFVARRRRRAGRAVAHLLALAQTLIVAQVALGLLLLSDHKRASDRLHYAYGTFALLCVLSPWLYAPADPRARLLWFGVATLVAAALAVRAYTTAT